MSEYCVVVAEGSMARFFTVEPAEIPELQSGPNLVETKQLKNTEHQAHADTLWADRTGRNRSPGGGQGHRYDDHREQHEDEIEKRFARDIIKELDHISRTNGIQHIVLCAEKRMLGFLRPTLNGALPDGVNLHEVAKDLAKFPPRKLHAHLAKEGHIPKRRIPNGH